ncbi:MAG: hypothetical protein QM755_21375 [Luteolibacter sp.]
MKILLSLLCLALSLAASAEDVPASKVRAAFAKTDTAPWVGQKVVIQVELLAPGYFAGAPVFDLPEVPGALLIPPVRLPLPLDRDDR